MHEFGIVRRIFQKIEASGKTQKAVVELGALKSVEPSMFHQLFHSMAQGTSLEKIQVEIKTVPLIVHCPACGFKGKIQDIPHLHTVFTSWPCPKCGEDAEILSGNEEEITELE